MNRKSIVIAVAQACRTIGQQYRNQFVQRMLREQQSK